MRHSLDGVETHRTIRIYAQRKTKIPPRSRHGFIAFRTDYLAERNGFCTRLHRFLLDVLSRRDAGKHTLLRCCSCSLFRHRHWSRRCGVAWYTRLIGRNHCDVPHLDFHRGNAPHLLSQTTRTRATHIIMGHRLASYSLHRLEVVFHLRHQLGANRWSRSYDCISRCAMVGTARPHLPSHYRILLRKHRFSLCFRLCAQ